MVTVNGPVTVSIEISDLDKVLSDKYPNPSFWMEHLSAMRDIEFKNRNVEVSGYAITMIYDDPEQGEIPFPITDMHLLQIISSYLVIREGAISKVVVADGEIYVTIE